MIGISPSFCCLLCRNRYFSTNTAKVLAGTSVSRVEPDTSMSFSTGWIASGRWMEFSAIGLSEWRVMTLPLVRALMPFRLSLMLWALSLILATLTYISLVGLLVTAEADSPFWSLSPATTLLFIVSGSTLVPL